MIDEYIIKYDISHQQKVKFHSSYLTLLKDVSKPILLRELKKHEHPGGEYIAWVSMSFLKSKNLENSKLLLNKPSFQIFLNSSHMNIGMISFDFTADNLTYSEGVRWPAVDPLEDISKHNPLFTLHDTFFLPSEAEMEKRARKAAENFVKSFNKFRFSCELVASDFPDVIFEISYATPLCEVLINKTYTTLENWVFQYNKRKEKDGGEAIHFIQLLVDKSIKNKENTVYIHIDFGGCDPTLLKNAVMVLDKTELPISHIVLK